MNTLILDKPGSLRVAQTDPPDEAPFGHALVKVHRVGVCGTDWHAYRGNQPFFSYPRVLGHELGVEVERVNDPASDLKPGDRCAVEPYLNCGECIACRRGRGNCCERLEVLGVHVDGGMTERIVVPTAKLHRSAELELDQLALVETLAIGGHAVKRASAEADEWALVIGAGPIGLAVATSLQAVGAQVIVMDVSEPRLAFCREQLGVTHTLSPGDDTAERLEAITGGQLPTSVFDATGNAESMAQTLRLTAYGGQVTFVGLCRDKVALDDPELHRRELTLRASRNALPADFKRIIESVERGEIDTRPWLTHRCRFDALPDHAEQWLAPDAGLIKAILYFD